MAVRRRRSGFALFNVVLYGAFARGASVVNVSMITALIPLAVLLVDVGFLRGRAHPLQWLGVALSFVGVLWLVSRGEPLALRENGIAPGDRLALVNVVIYAGYSLALRAAGALGESALGDVRGGDAGERAVLCGGALDARVSFAAVAGLVVARVCGAVCLDFVQAVLYGECAGYRREPRGADDEPATVFGALVGVAVFADERLGGYVLVALALVAAGIGLSEWGAMRLAFRRGA